MKILLPGNHTTKAMLWLCVILLLLVIAEVALYDPTGDDTSGDNSETEFALPERSQITFTPTPLQEFAEILERPLLFASRRIPVEEIVAIAATPRASLRLKLEGIAIGGDSRTALLRNTTNHQLLQLEEGQTHDGWTLETLSAVSAIFRRGEESSELVLETAPTGRRRP